MSFKSSNGKTLGKLLQVFNSDKTTLGQGIGAGGGASAPSIKAITASGGTETTLVAKDGNNYKLHTFTTAGIGTLTVSSTDTGATCYVVLQGGGGGGGSGSISASQSNRGGGGGGTGSLAYFSNFPITPGNYTIGVGTGGNGGIPSGGNGFSGQSSSFSRVGIAITIAGGSGGGQGGDASPGVGGAGGVGVVTFTPSSTGILLHAASIPGNTAGSNQNFGGGGGSIWDTNVETRVNLLYISPNPINGKGNGGGGGNFASGGNVGSDGYVRVFYQIPS